MPDGFQEPKEWEISWNCNRKVQVSTFLFYLAIEVMKVFCDIYGKKLPGYNHSSKLSGVEIKCHKNLSL